ncbi:MULTISPECIES: hypothetical protein [Corynebacterium]|uniref:Uncharacterized protein n=1 Tax=Corynebacterium lipophiloflavum (strain ATCC 700352 / DSM 44291 / CCUG 37336 / JCM 10383 / DMMZ 1944) TaxID=525263 RepID=C0XRM4_CORLD|nr:MULTISPECIES: hypothetical protein [Corynebacterium]EEI17074.1 hypothetical protein HMPREF0298_1094 [Corynebacterium lipophiloflavum DSM 44291]MCT1804817.1 hypothetical protein [Corynebacterium sanguinis]MCT2157801.1 hypothetical protein [Corynebacterium sanguinis]MCT2287529.1 hypothetical protein [Corynebacterium sanguinis]
MFDLFHLSPWLQLPIVLVVVLPLAGVAAAVILRVVDWLATPRERQVS